MKILSILLKVIAVILGIYFIPLGLFGVFGMNPAGYHDELWMRLASLYIAIIGCFYLYPNSKLRTSKSRIFYYSTTLSPIVILAIVLLVNVVKNEFHSFLNDEWITAIWVTITCSIFAPLSLYVYKMDSIGDN